MISFQSADGLSRGGSILTIEVDGSGTVRLFLPCGPYEDVTADVDLLTGRLRTEPIIVTLDQAALPHVVSAVAGTSVADRVIYDGETFELGAVSV